MLHTKFQASKPSGSEAEDILIFFFVFLWLELARGHLGPWDLRLNKSVRGELGNAGAGHLRTWDLHLNKLGKRTTRQYCIPNFKHLSQKVLKKTIYKYFYMYFYGSNLGPRGQRPSWTLGPSFE